MALMKKGKTWYFYAKVNGRTFKRTTGCTDKADAEKEVPRLKELVELLRRSPAAASTLRVAVIREAARVSEDVSLQQGERVGMALSNFLGWRNDVPLSQLKPEDIENYQRHRSQQVARSTVDKEITYLLSMLRRHGYDFPKPKPKPGTRTVWRPFTNDELARFFDACPERLVALFATMYCTGARPAELIPSHKSKHTALLKSEVDLDNKRITIRSAKSKIDDNVKVRVLSFPDWLVPILEGAMSDEPGPHIFRPTAGGLSHVFNKILKKAGIEKRNELGHVLTAHSFRHTFTTEIAGQVGHNPFALQATLGHSNISTSAHYCHLEAAVPDLPSPWQKKTPGEAPGYTPSVCTVIPMEE